MENTTALPCLTTEAYRLYEWILGRGGVVARTAPSDSLVPRSSVDNAIELLVHLKLLRWTPDGDRLVAIRPDVAVTELVEPLERQMSGLQRLADRTRSEFSMLSRVYVDQQQRKRHVEESIDHLLDEGSVNVLLDELAKDCEREALTIRPGGGCPAAELENSYAREVAMLSRGVHIRSLYQHPARFDAKTRAYVEDTARWGGASRTVRELNSKLTVFDGQVAVIPDHSNEDGGGAVVIRDPAVVRFLVTVFEQVWSHGVVFEGEARSHDRERSLASDVKASILRLLIQGVRDEAIARRMGLSVRTCRRHIAEMLEMVGAESRFQAGYLFAGRQLLDAHDEIGWA